MKLKKTIFLIKVLNLGLSNPRELFDIMVDMPYSKNNIEGFKDVSFENNYIQGALIQKTESFVRSYNEATNSLEKKKIEVFIESGFGIDFEQNCLDFYGAKYNFTRFKNALANLTNRKMILENITINLFDFISLMKGEGIDFDIKKLSINSFSYKNDAVGKFAATINTNKTGFYLLSEYQTDIEVASIEIFDEKNYHINISNSARLTIVCQDFEFNNILKRMKSLILKD